MSRRDRRPEALVLDDGVLRPGTVCEIGGRLAVEAQGGVVVTPWRDRFLAAGIAELEVVAHASEVGDGAYGQVVVHLQRSRAAAAEDLAEAWRILAPGGQLLFTGTNAVGVTSAVKRLARQLDQTPIVVTNRARARVVRFKRDGGAGPEREHTPEIEAQFEGLDGVADSLRLETRPGVFSAKRLDAGSRLLLEALPGFFGRKPPRRILDLGCGSGVLGLAAARLLPEATALLVDGDARAVECARANALRAGLDSRCQVAWWDARESPLGDRYDLALVNPPFHQHGTDVDLGPAFALFRSLGTWLSRSGRALVVANRTLPYEEVLADQGRVETLASTRGYKLLSLERRTRSSGARGRTSPGSRSGGSSRSPIRSR